MNAFPLEKTARRSASRKQKLFSEVDAWRAVGAGWRQLHGSFQELGVSFEWHEFSNDKPLDWAKSFHPGSIEICFNFAGSANVSCAAMRSEFTPLTVGFYSCGAGEIQAQRLPEKQHRFITVEFAQKFLKQHLQQQETFLHPLVREVVVNERAISGVEPATRLSQRQQEMVANLHQPPVMLAAQPLWYQSRALELMTEFFFQAPKEELFCMRQKRVANERVQRVIQLLQEKLAEPPTLEEIGRAAGCSPFYLSRTFSVEMGMTIPQFLRQLRMEKAAALLKTGKFNVTEVALEVGYNSLSHFSTTFHETFGCCPGLYSLSTLTQTSSISVPANS